MGDLERDRGYYRPINRLCLSGFRLNNCFAFNIDNVYNDRRWCGRCWLVRGYRDRYPAASSATTSTAAASSAYMHAYDKSDLDTRGRFGEPFVDNLKRHVGLYRPRCWYRLTACKRVYEYRPKPHDDLYHDREWGWRDSHLFDDPHCYRPNAFGTYLRA